MSIEALKWALDIGEELELEPPRRLVLIMLGNSADPTGGNLFPSHKYIARRTGMAKSTVRAHIAALQKDGLLVSAPRTRDDRGQTSNHYHLAMRQPGLGLEDTPLPDFSRGGAGSSTPPASRQAPPPASTKELKQEVGSGQPKGSPVAECFRIYAKGIKAKYGAEYPPSASANGMLAQVVKKLGAEPAKAVVQAYLNDTDPWYAKQVHDLRYLQRDCTKIWLRLQRAAGGTAETAVTEGRTYTTDAAGTERPIGPCKPGDPLAIARGIAKDYGTLLAKRAAKGIIVQLGPKRHTFSVEELRR